MPRVRSRLGLKFAERFGIASHLEIPGTFDTPLLCPPFNTNCSLPVNYRLQAKFLILKRGAKIEIYVQTWHGDPPGYRIAGARVRTCPRIKRLDGEVRVSKRRRIAVGVDEGAAGVWVGLAVLGTETE